MHKQETNDMLLDTPFSFRFLFEISGGRTYPLFSFLAGRFSIASGDIKRKNISESSV